MGKVVAPDICRICGLGPDTHDDSERAAQGDASGLEPVKSDHYYERDGCQVCADNDYENTDDHDTRKHFTSGPLSD